jgi:hypothetical protein
MTTRLAAAPDPGPALRLLSLGAGVQSTTVLLLACEGVIPRFDVALPTPAGNPARSMPTSPASVPMPRRSAFSGPHRPVRTSRCRPGRAALGWRGECMPPPTHLEVEHIERSLSGRGYWLHAFGAKILGLIRYATAVASSDSAPWSLRGWHVPGCTLTHRSESNCLLFALTWHDRVLHTPHTQ